MSTYSIMSKDAADFRSSYTFEQQIRLFRSEVDVSFLADEDRVILKIYLPLEKVTINVFFKPPSKYLYFYSSFNKDMGVIFPLSDFSTEILRVLNIAPINWFPRSRVISRHLRWSVSTWSLHRPRESFSLFSPLSCQR